MPNSAEIFIAVAISLLMLSAKKLNGAGDAIGSLLRRISGKSPPESSEP